MNDMAELKMESCKNHPEKQQIFYLEKMLDEAGYPYFFNFREDMQPAFGGEADGDPESIEWDSYNFLIEVGQLAGYDLAQLSICFNRNGDGRLLELLDMRPAENRKNPTAKDGELYTSMTAEECMEIIEKFFESLPLVQYPDLEDNDDWIDEEDAIMPESMKSAIRSISGVNPDKIDRRAKKQKAKAGKR